eukprot:TRINITY_DN1711_c0_g1_i1.p1 TRINITY_DN1711_c0_g1~~TRINITY_DN1711_c0_g1_i1.p1  ORF type:complete len:124 (-),score=13.66 TRINITY_DN1711_c0_g1_i1:28-399(-)
MVQKETVLEIIDNTGARVGRCLHVYSRKDGRAYIGDHVLLSVLSALPGKKVAKGEMHRAVVVRQRGWSRRSDGIYYRWNQNAAVLLNSKSQPLGTRIKGPIPFEAVMKNPLCAKFFALSPLIL